MDSLKNKIIPKIVNTKVEITGSIFIDIPVYFEDTNNEEIIDELFEYSITDKSEITCLLGKFTDESQVTDYTINKAYIEYTCDNCKKKLTKEEWIQGKGFCKECSKKYNN